MSSTEAKTVVTQTRQGDVILAMLGIQLVPLQQGHCLSHGNRKVALVIWW